MMATLALGCGGDSAGPSREQGPTPPTVGFYRIAMEGRYPWGGAWSRSFRVELTTATRDSLVFTTFDGDLPRGNTVTADLIYWSESPHWHAHVQLISAPDVIVNWYPDLSCTGRLFYGFGESYPPDTCLIARDDPEPDA